MAWWPKDGYASGTSQDLLRLRALQQQQQQQRSGMSAAQFSMNDPAALAANNLTTPSNIPLQQLLNAGAAGNQHILGGGASAGNASSFVQQAGHPGLKVVRPGNAGYVGSAVIPGMAGNLQLQQQQQHLHLGQQQLSGGPGVGVVLGGGAPNNQAAILALMQQQLLQQQGGNIPAVPSVMQANSAGSHQLQQLYNLQQLQAQLGLSHQGQLNPATSNLVASATAQAAAQQVANMRTQAALAAGRGTGGYNLLPKLQQLGMDIGGGARMGQQQFGLVNQGGPQLNLHQLALLTQAANQNPQYTALQQQRLPTGSTGQLQHAHLQSQMQLQMGGNGQVPNQMGQGLANTPMGSAPLLPILGTDLAKPSASKTSAPISLESSTSSMTSAATVGSPNRSVTSQESGSVKSADTPQMGNSISMPSSSSLSVELNKPKVSESPVGIGGGALDLSGLNQAQISALLNRGRQSDIQLIAAQLGLTSGPQAGGVKPSPVLGVPVPGVTAGSSPTAAGGIPKERDLGTLRTLGQMLARTGNTVESAVQTGLLGGCNAEDVKIVWEAYAVEVAALKQQTSDLKAVDVGSLGGVKVSEEALKSMLTAGPIGTPSSGSAQPVGSQEGEGKASEAGKDKAEAPAQEKNEEEEDEEDDIDWDGIIENEEDFVPKQVISEVNSATERDLQKMAEAAKSDAFNAFSYGFFSGCADEEGELLELGDGDELELEGGLPEGDTDTPEVNEVALEEDGDEEDGDTEEPTETWDEAGADAVQADDKDSAFAGDKQEVGPKSEEVPVAEMSDLSLGM